jgi:hypothetical protein
MANSRKAADLFFVCRLTLTEDRPPASSENNDDDDDDADYWTTLFRACPNEIASIQWMKIADFIEQPLWQQSPLYQQLNKVLFFDDEKKGNNEKHRFWQHSTMPIRHDLPTANTLYHPVQNDDNDGDDASAIASSSAL